MIHNLRQDQYGWYKMLIHHWEIQHSSYTGRIYMKVSTDENGTLFETEIFDKKIQGGGLFGIYAMGIVSIIIHQVPHKVPFSMFSPLTPLPFKDEVYYFNMKYSYCPL